MAAKKDLNLISKQELKRYIAAISNERDHFLEKKGHKPDDLRKELHLMRKTNDELIFLSNFNKFDKMFNHLYKSQIVSSLQMNLQNADTFDNITVIQYDSDIYSENDTVEIVNNYYAAFYIDNKTKNIAVTLFYMKIIFINAGHSDRFNFTGPFYFNNESGSISKLEKILRTHNTMIEELGLRYGYKKLLTSF